MKHNWFVRILIALDQLLNALLRGSPDETLSARAHRRRLAGSKKWAYIEKGIDMLFFWQPEHCAKAFRFELRRGDLPKEYW